MSPITPQERRFWSRVLPVGDHLVWTGMGRPEPQCDWTVEGQTRRTTPARVAWLLLRAEQVPEDRYLRRTCDRPRCVAPDHHTTVSDHGARPSLARIRKDVLSDGQGGFVHARCGTALRNAPRPGRRTYCPVCYQIDQELIKAAEQARIAQLRRTGSPTPIDYPTYQGTDRDDPSDSDSTPPDATTTPTYGGRPTRDDIEEALAMFEDYTPTPKEKA